MVVCVHLPRFELIVAAGESRALAGRALAVAPCPGAERRVGEVSGAAEARGVTRGMALAEALARCPDLALVPADPVGVVETAERMVRALESIGAAVEPAAPGLAYFEARGLRSLHGTDDATIVAARRAGWSAARRPLRVGAGPTRFCALALALAARPRRPLVVGGREGAVRAARRWLAGQPVDLFAHRRQTAGLVAPLRRLGVHTLGELQRLGRDALADRFGAAGALAHRLACGDDEPLHARRAPERVRETMHVGDASSGQALQRVLGVLVDRLLARPERRGRTLRALVLCARLLAGGGWRERVVLRQALADSRRVTLALTARLALLPAPAAELGLEVECFGPPGGEQQALLDHARSARAGRLEEAVAQARAVAGSDAVLRAVCVDPDSRVPERRVLLTPRPG
jgi:nucleotidyltransferase/DNA polymerase involved in DNA repair